jgi:hypothetical protein
MLEYIPHIIAGLALLLGIRQFIYQKNNDASAKILKIADEISKVADEFGDKFTKLLERIAKLESGADYSWKMIEMYAGKILHHPITPHIDWYIDKNESQGLDRKEAKEFANILDGIIKDGDNDGRKAAATLMLAAIVRRYKLTVRL